MTDILFDKLQSQETKFPEQIRCAYCGAMVPLEDFDSDPGEWVLGAYFCPACDWWTEWEIILCDNGIRSTMFYYSLDRNDVIIGDEARQWPGFWRPDGFTLPECATKPLE
jgi:hypothetical protein